MPTKLESKGSYRFRILESGFGLTKKGFPQVSLRLKAIEKYVEDATEITHFQGQNLLADGKPGWVPWEAFDEEAVEFFVLFKSATEFTKDTALLNYEQLQIATGWDGTEFGSLVDGTLVSKMILGRVDFDSYTNEAGKTSEGFRVKWIDKADADPNRSLKSVDLTQINALTAILKMGGIGKSTKPAAAVAAKPAVAKAAAPIATTAGPSPASAPATASKPPTVESSSPASSPTTASKPPAAAKKKPKVEPPTLATPPAAEATLESAWAFLVENKGTASDDAATQAWIDACGDVCPDKEQTDFTPADWAKIRDLAITKLAA